MKNEIRVTLYKNINSVNIDIKDQNLLFEKMEKSIKHIRNANHSIIIRKKTESFFSYILNKIKSIFNVKTSIESCRGKMNVDFYSQLNANTCFFKIRDTNDITLDEISVMNLFFKFSADNSKEIINSFIKRNVKTKADLILIDKLFYSHEKRKLDKVDLKDFVDEKFSVEDVINLFNMITLDVINDINNSIFLFILNSFTNKNLEGLISNITDGVFNLIKHDKYYFKNEKSIFNNSEITKIARNISIDEFISKIKGDLEIEGVSINDIIYNAFQKYDNADNYVKTQEEWINKLYNKEEQIIYNINKNRILVTKKIEEIVSLLDDDEMIIGMPKEQYIIRMEQLFDMFATVPIINNID